MDATERLEAIRLFLLSLMADDDLESYGVVELIDALLEMIG